MPTCQFCDKKFPSKQSVRAHLRHCDAYQGRARQAGLPIGKRAYIGRDLPKAAKAAGFDPAAHVKAQVEVAEGELKLKQLKAVHDELDQKEIERARRARQEAETARQREQEQAQAHLQAELEAEERKQREAEAESRRQARRQRIQRAKDAADWGFVPGKLVEVPVEVRAATKREIEQELSALPALEELSQGEVDEIAEGIAARHHRPLVEEDARRKEEDRRRKEEERQQKEKEAERERQEQEKKWAEWRQQLEREERVDKLVREGDDFASEELDELGIRPGLERYEVLEKIKAGLRERLTGQESTAEIEDMVEEILARSLKRTKGRR